MITTGCNKPNYNKFIYFQIYTLTKHFGGIYYENRNYRSNRKAGSRILKEALNRGHEVTAIVRNAAKLQKKT